MSRLLDAVRRRDMKATVRELVLHAILRTLASGYRARGMKKIRGRRRKFRALREHLKGTSSV